MIKHLIAATLPLSALALAACDSGTGQAPGAVSEGEAQALEEAAEMLDERRLPEGTLPPTSQDDLTQEPAEEVAPE